MELPEVFSEKIRALIGDEEFGRYVSELDKQCVHGLRANRLKLSSEALCRLPGMDAVISSDHMVPWCDDGFYFDIDPEKMPGRMAYYLAGLYYIQEPSAMYPAANAQIKPGERVLDLCAAPGGKSLRAASDLACSGLLVSNDISAGRAGTLLYNLELGGVPNVTVTNCSPAELRERFGEYFDAVLIDAPCSGEGMFRKDPNALKEWQSFTTEKCMEMQRGILTEAAGLVRPGGRIVYSTCTFDMGENESMMEWFMQGHPDFGLAEMPKTGGVADGNVTGSHPESIRCARLWPQSLQGEGQFAAMLVKGSGNEIDGDDVSGGRDGERKAEKCRSYRRLRQYPEELRAFAEKNLNLLPFDGWNFYVMGNFLYACPFEPFNIDRLKVLRMGVQIGEINYEKLKPSQQFIMTLRSGDFKRKCELDPFGNDVKKYLRGESLWVENASDGFSAVCVNGFQLGGAELKGGMLKNLYPKGWRRII